MCEDIQYRFPDIPQNDVHNIGLYEIKKLLAPMGMALIDLGLDEPAPLHHSYLSFVNKLNNFIHIHVLGHLANFK